MTGAAGQLTGFFYKNIILFIVFDLTNQPPAQDLTMTLWNSACESGRGTQTFRHWDRRVHGRMQDALIVPLEKVSV